MPRLASWPVSSGSGVVHREDMAVQHFMLRLERTLARRRWLVLGAWLILLAVALPFAARQGEHLTGGGFGVPGSQSREVMQALDRDFGRVGRAQLAVVLDPGPRATPADMRAALARVRTGAGAVAEVRLDSAAVRRAAEQARSARPRPLVVALPTTVDDVKSTDVAKDLRDELGAGTGQAGPVSVDLIGQGALWAALQDVSKKDLAQAEHTGFPIVLLILLAVFGSLAAATLPLALGAASVLITGGAIYWLSRATDMSVFVTNMASMVGIGVAVDYSLFVLARYRDEVRRGLSPDRARGVALATSGVAVTFSGLTVMVSLARLFLVNTTALRSMALGAIVVVAVSVLASATLLPVLLRVLGHRAYARGRVFNVVPLALRTRARRRRGSTRPDRPARRGFWQAWTDRVTRRPALSAILASAALLALAWPAIQLKTSDGALRQLPESEPTRQGAEIAGRLEGPGGATALKVVAPASEAAAVRRML